MARKKTQTKTKALAVVEYKTTAKKRKPVHAITKILYVSVKKNK